MVTYPSDWKETLVERITKTIITGGTPSTLIDKYWGGNIPWLASTEIHQKLITKATKNITDIGLNNSSAKIAPKDSVLVALAGQGKTRGTAGFLAYPMALNQSLAALVASDETDSKFLFYLIESMYIYLRELSSGDGGRGGLNKTLLKTICVNIPKDFQEQQAIASVLSDIDEHIDNLTKLIEKKKGIRDGALDDLVSGRTRLDGFDGEWEEKSLKDLGDVLTGLTYSPDNIRPYGKLVIRSSNVQDDRLVFEDNVFVDRSCVNSEDVKKGDIIICVRNGSSSLIGKSAYVTSDLDATFGAFMSNFRCENKRSSGFIYYFTKSIEFKNFVKQILGATINQITKTDLKKVVLKIPVDIKEQQAIASILTDMDEEIEALEIEKAKMVGIREGAMDDLLTGRVRLKV
jgi:type I restriction enzyme S subunit